MAKERKTLNEEWLDSLIRHQTYLLRYAAGVNRKITDLLNATEKDMAAQIVDRLGDTKGISPRSLKRFQAIQNYIRNVRGKSWNKVGDMWLDQFTQLVKQEPEFAGNNLSNFSPVVLDTIIPEESLLSGIVDEHPFEGKVLSTWARDIAATDIDRIEAQIKIGMVQGEDSQTIARRIIGSARLKGLDGVTQITRNNANALTRTAVNSLAAAARNVFYQANAELFEAELYVATLDARTTAVCRSLDGQTFKPGTGPQPPLHFNCRSLRVPVINDEVLGDRPFKASTEKQLIREYNVQNGLAATSRDNLPRGHKGLFDAFSRQRVRELTGIVPAKTSYQEWLKKQTTAFQDDTLGKTKAKLFRDGGLTLDKFVDARGTELTLGELSQRHAEVFRQAGLNPDDF